MTDDTPLTWAQRAAWYELEDRPTGEERRFWLAACDRAPSVLVVPAGAGSLTCALTAPQRRTVAADIEERMVRRARGRLAKRPGDNAALIADMRTMRLDETFARVCVPRAALQLLSPDDQQGALVALARHVDPRGLLIVDLVRLGPTRAGRTAFYDPSVTDGVTAFDWTRRLPDGGYVTRRRTQHHTPSGVDLRFEDSLAPTRSSATAAAACAHAAVCLRELDDAALKARARFADLAVACDATIDERSCRWRVALSRCDQLASARLSSSRKCATPSSRPGVSGPGSK